jgi:hypothetical protein|uniref:Uncharacterized protein n=1 Tax=Zea mays TaxID=4577 RepID=C0PBR9_MAIZE|nr:unknown [Zea mays]
MRRATVPCNRAQYPARRQHARARVSVSLAGGIGGGGGWLVAVLLLLVLILLLLLLLLRLLVLVSEGGGGERAADPDVGLEVDLVALVPVEAHLDDGHPEHDLLAAHPGHALHPAVLHVRGDLGVVAHPRARAAEVVLVGGLLPHPHEPGLAHPAALLQPPQRHHAAREAQRLEHLLGVREAGLRARDDLRALALLVAAGRRGLRGHGEGSHRAAS